MQITQSIASLMIWWLFDAVKCVIFTPVLVFWSTNGIHTGPRFSQKKPPSPVNTILTNYNAIISPPIHPQCQYQHLSWNTLCHTIILTQYHANTPSMLWTIFSHLHHPPPRSTPDSWSSTICWLLYRAQILVVFIYITRSLSRAGWTIVFWPLWCVQVVVSSSSEYLTTNK